MKLTTLQRLLFFFAVISLLSTATLRAGESFPAVYASLEDSVVRVGADGSLDWSYPLRDQVSLELQPSGNLLVAGWSGNVFLLSRVGRNFKVVWDWSQMGLKGGVYSAVAAERDLNGNPTLILAAIGDGNRIILADARRTRPKIRWERKIDLPIRQAVRCPDTGNFLVLSWSDSVNWAIEEIDFRTEKVVWSLKPGDGPGFPVGIARDKQGRTFVADLENDCRAYDGNKRLLWKTSKGCQHTLKHMTALVKSFGDRVLYLTNNSEPEILDAATGETLGCRSDLYPAGASLFEPKTSVWWDVEPESGLMRRPLER